ncbi:MAG: helix-turn-helix domain-containing protein [DPANN group archaeon]|nr:helix-turn-helix domain-containing protein [DPANN group archaeon]
MNEQDVSKDQLSKNMAGEIVISDKPNNTIKKWRNMFRVSQRNLAAEMKVMPSVISDYESGRRKSPGIEMIKKIVNALIKIDEKNGSLIINEFTSLHSKNILNDAIIDIKEIPRPVTLKEFIDTIDGKIIVGKDNINKKIYGYTIIDSIKAIVGLSPSELIRLYGLTTERAMIFTGVKSGRSSLIAMKVTNLKPGVVVLHNMEKLDKLAKKIAEMENIPIIITQIKNIDTLILKLKKIL